MIRRRHREGHTKILNDLQSQMLCHVNMAANREQRCFGTITPVTVARRRLANVIRK